jgi:hypothetical protein
MKPWRCEVRAASVLRVLTLFLILHLISPAHDAAANDRMAAPPKSLYDRRRRAGGPERTAPWAACTYGKVYSGVYVGGGALFRGKRSAISGERRNGLEGTFGIDYDPWWSRVGLSWYHGTRYQGGEGQYEPTRRNLPLGNFRR